jgi:hypothetical protein
LVAVLRVIRLERQIELRELKCGGAKLQRVGAVENHGEARALVAVPRQYLTRRELGLRQANPGKDELSDLIAERAFAESLRHDDPEPLVGGCLAGVEKFRANVRRAPDNVKTTALGPRVLSWTRLGPARAAYKTLTRCANIALSIELQRLYTTLYTNERRFGG